MSTPLPTPKHCVTPYLIVDGAAEAIDFYRRVFAANELFRLTGPDGKIGHAELRIGDANLLLADEYPDFALGPLRIGGSPVTIHLYLADVDATIALAEAAGAKLLRPATDEFFGDRCATLVDPFGHRWMLASRIEDVTPAEMQRRWDQGVAQ
ncbi:PhnB protein [Janthinobacterium sp. CG_23.3]|uniref:VOC family protein n=1 Tax=unclassified Janthinobacterium TaxID=2610881 RepID=UPI0004769CDA|nr:MULTISPECIES: VOC family protein [unclassified Janthinobacterium]MEC5161288.1 PhnB protein [Janthinobacterium sp. CG_S6]